MYPRDAEKVNFEDAGVFFVHKNGSKKPGAMSMSDLNKGLVINGQRIPSVAPGALPIGPAGQIRYMVLETEGRWTWSGTSFDNPKDSTMTLWWDGAIWKLESKVPKPKGEDGATIGEDWVPGTYKAKVIRALDGVQYRVKPGVASTTQRPPGTDWEVWGNKGVYTIGAKTILGSQESFPTKGFYNLSGQIQTATGTYITDFIPCKRGDNIIAEVITGTASYSIIIFDANKNYLRGVIGGNTAIIGTYRTQILNDNEVFYRVSTVAGATPNWTGVRVTQEDGVSKKYIDKGALAITDSNEEIPVSAAVIKYVRDSGITSAISILHPFLPNESDGFDIDLTLLVEQGGIDGAGNNAANSARLRTRTFIDAGVLEVNKGTIGNGEFTVAFFRADNTFIGITDWITTVGKRTFAMPGAAKTKMAFRRSDNANIVPSQFPALGIIAKGISTDPLQLASTLDTEMASRGSISRIPNKIANLGRVISNFSKEKMTHDGNLQIDSRGNFLLPYYASNTSFDENPNASGVSSRLSLLNVCNLNSTPEFFEMFTKSQNIGNDQFSDITSPYVPFIFHHNQPTGIILYLASAILQNDSQGARIVGRKWNVENKSWIDETLHKCTLKYDFEGGTKTVHFSESGVSELVKDKQGRIVSNTGMQTVMSRWKLYKGEYYTMFGTLGNGTSGVIVKTTDGIEYTVVDFFPYSQYNIWEGSIEFVEDTLYGVLRNSTDLFTRDMITGAWKTVKNVMANIQYQRMALHKKDGYIYMFYNILPRTGAGWTQQRNNIRIAKFSATEPIVIATQEIASPLGIHYYGFSDYRGTTWVYFTEDRRNLNPTDPKTNITLMEWGELVKI